MALPGTPCAGRFLAGSQESGVWFGEGFCLLLRLRSSDDSWQPRRWGGSSRSRGRRAEGQLWLKDGAVRSLAPQVGVGHSGQEWWLCTGWSWVDFEQWARLWDMGAGSPRDWPTSLLFPGGARAPCRLQGVDRGQGSPCRPPSCPPWTPLSLAQGAAELLSGACPPGPAQPLWF